MIDMLSDPFTYDYMRKALLVCAMIGGTCGFLSAFLMLKGWSLMGDALSHAIVPGVALSSILGLPYAIGAFFAGMLAALSMWLVKQKTKLREDVTIGLVFTTFFAIGLVMISISPVSVNLQAIILGNILSISDYDVSQISIICGICFAVLMFIKRDLTSIFFDETHAKSLGIAVTAHKIIFFSLLSAASVAALQAVGTCLVIATVITPGATAYLLCNRMERLIMLSVILGTLTSVAGAYASYFINAHPGGLIVLIQTAIFLLALLLAPGHGMIGKHKGRRT